MEYETVTGGGLEKKRDILYSRASTLGLAIVRKLSPGTKVPNIETTYEEIMNAIDGASDETSLTIAEQKIEELRKMVNSI